VAVSPPLAAARRDVLLSTKLHAPGARPGFVSRSRLTERLDEALGRGLVLVCAPAGYGKTALLAGWARHRERPVAWLSLDAVARALQLDEGERLHLAMWPVPLAPRPRQTG
jgi:LuxR family maltose regulon positive regulatory protein